MILTCPECSTRYMAQPDSIGPAGRTVRCARCEAVWFQKPEAPDPDALALEDNRAVLVEVEPEPQPELPLEPPKSVGAHTLLRDKAAAGRLAARRRTIRLIWAVPILTLLAGAISALVFRQAIVARAPAAASLYAKLGLTVKQDALDIADVQSRTLRTENGAVLRVSGEVRNLASTAQRPAPIQMRLLNRAGDPVAEWIVEVDTIAAKGAATFETDYPDPPVDGVELIYRFAPE